MRLIGEDAKPMFFLHDCTQNSDAYFAIVFILLGVWHKHVLNLHVDIYYSSYVC